MLLEREQHSTPAATLEQEGRAFFSEKFGEHENTGIKPKAKAEETTTPRGWKMERQARRKRRF